MVRFKHTFPVRISVLHPSVPQTEPPFDQWPKNLYDKYFRVQEHFTIHGENFADVSIAAFYNQACF